MKYYFNDCLINEQLKSKLKEAQEQKFEKRPSSNDDSYRIEVLNKHIHNLERSNARLSKQLAELSTPPSLPVAEKKAAVEEQALIQKSTPPTPQKIEGE